MTLAFIFSDVGAGEWFLLLAVILIVMGPKRLPETARKFGHYYSKFRRAADSFKRQLMEMDTEFNNAVSDAQKQAESAFSIDDEPKHGDSAQEESSGIGDYNPESPYPGYGRENDYPGYPDYSDDAHADASQDGEPSVAEAGQSDPAGAEPPVKEA
jgi:Sec-independent protein translocase protein TatA